MTRPFSPAQSSHRRWLVAAAPLMALAAAGQGHGAERPAGAAARPPSASTAAPPETLAGTSGFDLRSRGGLDYRIQVAEPPGAAPAQGRPVVLLTDGNAYFGAAASLLRLWSEALPGLARLPPQPGGKAFAPGVAPLFVGVGYPGPAALNGPRRTFDFVATPTGLGTSERERLGAEPGGADAFLDFLLEELLPALERRHAVAPGRLTLAGHSLGGLFALHALLRRPEAFHAIAAISPSIWVNPEGLSQGVQELRRRPPARLPASVLLAVARDEVPTHPDRSATMLADARAMHGQLQPLGRHGTQVRLMELEEENHMTTPFCTLPAVLRIAGAAPA